MYKLKEKIINLETDLVAKNEKIQYYETEGAIGQLQNKIALLEK